MGTIGWWVVVLIIVGAIVLGVIMGGDPGDDHDDWGTGSF